MRSITATRTSTDSADGGRCGARVSACWGSCRASTTTCCRASPTARPRTPPRSATALADIADVTVSAPVKEREDAEREIAALRDVDGLLVVMLTYGPAMRVARLLAETPLPICLANIQPVPEVTPAWDMGDLTYNQGIHGAQDTANAIVRAGRPFHVVTGDWRSDAFREADRRWATRGRGDHPLAGAEGRGVRLSDERDGRHRGSTRTRSCATLGPQIDALAPGDLHRAAAAVLGGRRGGADRVTRTRASRSIPG